ncbi:DUF2163 domain-containing protein [Methylobacterium gnaphalii]|uniref:Bacteriophage phiJL001 Gp84 C-terminal domain-containing protein n=1 Tax=Methylobacterium gnaphalii TaxID=1010610 RepID=A0A512JI30_9HYPH|nr:DUF2163 domain-containing protein [Methylobacterium gnaphalii]GEP09596.1 hypothetical protein MGN01_14410 [Methylobacterium gnaphalii]GJD67817.1 hypothetical protein MMMDOFMJ_0734 [Methylobacterium gnaphalii]GLS51449.1 hypothetical protein GCM10007885_43060 [Methylobacterium gnaphalii]
MREMPAALAARLAEGATTLCHCWSLTRRDGVALGFTDHDRDLTLDGLTYAAGSGLEAAEASAELGFAVGGGDVAGALSSAGIAPDDIAAGLYDGASVETWLVDWSAPEARLLLDVATLGEIRRAGTAFVAELRGLMQALDVEQGRLYRATCDAELGEPRCGIDLADPRWRTSGTVLALAGPSRLAVGLGGAFAECWFAAGRLRWMSGANASLDADLRAHGRSGTTVTLDLWQPPARAISPGDAFTLTAGCDKRFATCREKIANSLNFQGFPHMPGNDFVIRPAPGSSTALDGGSLFR